MQSRPVVAACIVAVVATALFLAISSFAEPPGEESEGKIKGDRAPLIASPASTTSGAGKGSLGVDSAASPSTTPPSMRPADADPAPSEKDNGKRAGSRFQRDLGRLFARAPGAVEVSDLDRHVDLNLVDAALTSSQVDALEEIIRRNQAHLEAAVQTMGKKRHQTVLTLHRNNLLTELRFQDLTKEQQERVLSEARLVGPMLAARRAATKLSNPALANVDASVTTKSAISTILRKRGPEFVPGAHSYLVHNGRIFIAKDKQMPHLEEVFNELSSAKRSFIYEVLGWFVEEGLTMSDRAMKIAERFETWMKDF